MASTSLQVAGLASNFDWKSFVDQIMVLERKPAERLESEQTVNTRKVNLLATLGTKLTGLKSSATALQTEDLFGARTAKSSKSASTWSASAAADTAVGTYQIAVSQLATRAVLTGGTGAGGQGVGARLSATDGSDVTLSTLATATSLTAGTFTVEGKQFTITGAENLKDVLDDIKTQTGLSDAYYDNTTDEVVLGKASGALMLGAPGDTSNFLQVLKLASSAGSSVSSSSALGTAKASAALASGNFATAVTGDGSGNGVLSINGAAISYNVNTDTLSTVLAKINASTAGVVATYDTSQDRIVLTNANTGGGGIAVSDTTGNLAAALNLTSGAAFTAGKNAEFTINGSGPYTSSTNTLSSAAHGITGLSVTVDSETTETISVAADTSGMRTKIEDFIAKFNDVQQYLEDQTKITRDAKGKVIAAPLSSNREIQDWGRSLRAKAFGEISGLSGSITRLDHLGIDFDSTSGDLKIKDSAKLEAALSGKASEVADFFQNADVGLAEQFDDYLDNISDLNTDQQDRLNKTNSSLDEQIANIERHLEQQRSIMESAFIAMENAQSKIKQQEQMLTGAFANK